MPSCDILWSLMKVFMSTFRNFEAWRALPSSVWKYIWSTLAPFFRFRFSAPTISTSSSPR